MAIILKLTFQINKSIEPNNKNAQTKSDDESNEDEDNSDGPVHKNSLKLINNWGSSQNQQIRWTFKKKKFKIFFSNTKKKILILKKTKFFTKLTDLTKKILSFFHFWKSKISFSSLFSFVFFSFLHFCSTSYFMSYFYLFWLISCLFLTYTQINVK